MSAQPVHRFAHADAKWFAALEFRHPTLDFRVVKNPRLGFVAFERSRELRRHLADKIGRDFHNLRGPYTCGGGYLQNDLVPGQNLVAGDVKSLTNRLGL